MSFNVALSGLNAASSNLDVIGNNVANASTTGFKQSRTEFVDIYAASQLGVASNAIGSGVKVASVDQQFNQGNINFTNNNLDLAISGSGFFRLDDNGVAVYTRAGAFGVDRDGYIVNSQAQKLTGYGADAGGNINGALGPLQLNTADLSPLATTKVTAQINVDSRQTTPTVAFDPTQPASYNHSTSLTSYDSLGNPILTTMYFVKTGANTWDTYTYLTPPGGTAMQAPPGAVPVTFNDDGTLQAVGAGGTTAPLGAVDPGTGATPMALTLDFTGMTQFGNSFSVNSLSQDGYTTGRLSGVDIDDTGIVTARYTNGQSKTLAQVALANFTNPQGLRQMGDSTWAETYGSGAALIGAPGTGSLGMIQSGALEGSNVDLTEQLVGMITAQRNYQANAQVIKTDDTITQTIINMR